ncbi:YhhN-like protein, partial [Cladorrhinum samala]
TLSGAVLTGSIASGVVYQTLVRSPPSRTRMTIKTASTALLSAAAYLRSAPPLLVGALALGSLGDAFLSWDDDDDDGGNSFLFGLASFLAAHILYIILFFRSGLGANDVSSKIYVLLTHSRLRTWIAGALAGLVPGMIRQLWPKVGKGLRVPVVVYTLTIFVMANVALTVESDKVVAGAVMFTASDSILAAGKFLVPRGSRFQGAMSHAVWVLYYGGQLLIALG